jgi:hypothetical protein
MNGLCAFRVFLKLRIFRKHLKKWIREFLKKNEQTGLKMQEIVIGILTYTYWNECY